MACHTWFYYKDTITLEQALELIRSRVLQIKKSKDRKANKTKKVLAPDWSKLAPGWSLNNLYEWSWIYETLLYDFGDDLRRGKRCKVTEKGVFLETEEYYDLFRISGYPEDKLHSLDETLEFIIRHGIDEVDWNGLEDFWVKHPDGLIDFG